MEQPPANDVPLATAVDAGASYLGVLDVLIGFGVVLEQQGLVSRAKIAGIMAMLIEQDIATGQHPARQHAAAMLKEYFERPI